MRLLASLLLAITVLHAALIEGNPQSRIRVIVFEDLEDAKSAQLRILLDTKILPAFGSQVAFERCDLPAPSHKWARRAAMAARYFDQQNPKLGLEFRRQVLASQTQLTSEALASWIANFARTFAVDPVKAVDAARDPNVAALLEKDATRAATLGVSAAPAFVIGQHIMADPLSANALTEQIQAALNQTKK